MRVILAAVLIFLAHTASAAPFAAWSLDPGTSHYFENFDPELKPWHPGQELNIEEVFKNYQFYEIRLLNQGTEVEVRRYIQNQVDTVERYHIMPDGALGKIAQ